MRERGRRVGEMFVPLSHGPGHAQYIRSEALAVIAGVERKVQNPVDGPAAHHDLLDSFDRPSHC